MQFPSTNRRRTIVATLLKVEASVVFALGTFLLIKGLTSKVEAVSALIGVIAFALLGGVGLLGAARGFSTGKNYGRAIFAITDSEGGSRQSHRLRSCLLSGGGTFLGNGTSFSAHSVGDADSFNFHTSQLVARRHKDEIVLYLACSIPALTSFQLFPTFSNFFQLFPTFSKFLAPCVIGRLQGLSRVP